MGKGYGIECEKCSYTRSVSVGVGMSHYSLEQCIKSVSKTEQIKIKEIISGKKNLIDEGEGDSVYQCSKCCAIANKFQIKLIENNKTIYETRIVCYKCKIDMKHLPCDQEEDTITGIKCPKCKSDAVTLSHNMMWD